MKIKHKLLSDYQYVSPDKKIFLIKSGTIVEEYCYKLKGELIPLDKDIIDINPEIFELIDWKAELMSFMKANKMPQPAQLGKKLIPFFEEMVLSSIQQNTPTSDVSTRDIEKRENEIYSLKREIERRELDVESRERRLKDKEDDLEIRQKRVEKREGDYKEDLKTIQKKEDDLRSRNKELTNKDLDIQDRLNELNEKERNLDRNVLSSAKEFDAKYAELQAKIDEDLASLTKREKNLEIESKRIKDLEKSIENNISELVESNRSKIYQDLETELRGIESEIRRIYDTAEALNQINIERKNKGFRDEPYITHYTDQLLSSISKLKERIDNNLLD